MSILKRGSGWFFYLCFVKRILFFGEMVFVMYFISLVCMFFCLSYNSFFMFISCLYFFFRENFCVVFIVFIVFDSNVFVGIFLFVGFFLCCLGIMDVRF